MKDINLYPPQVVTDSPRRVQTNLCQPDRLYRGHKCHVEEEHTDKDAQDKGEIPHEHKGVDVALPCHVDTLFRSDAFCNRG